MNPLKNNKNKILACLTVIILFLLVGGLFFFISLKNRERTKKLRQAVIERQRVQDLAERFNNIYLDTTATSSPLTSKSYLTMIMTGDGDEKILNQKNPDLVWPIASVTKLMTAIIILENVDLEMPVTATLDYIGQEESFFVLKTDKKYRVKDLLANALIASDNDSARLLSSTLGKNNFVAKMNQRARELDLTQTHFFNVTGLDPIASSSDELNVSTATDLANLLIFIQKTYPEILKITTQTEYNFCETENSCQIVNNTNKLLNNKDFQLKILGGKTGYTDLAGKNLVLVTDILNDIVLVNIVLGSNDNFVDTLSLINQIKVQD